MEELSESNISTKTIQRIVNLRLENDKTTLDAITELSTFMASNCPVNRRQLRSTIEKRHVDINRQFLNSLKEVHKSLDDIYSDVSQMNGAVNDMVRALSSAKSKTKSLIDETTQLQKQIQSIDTKIYVSNSLTNRFQLSSKEVASLHNSNVTTDMLNALDRIEEIQNNCKILSSAGCNTLAQDIIDQTTSYMEKGMERLFRWAQARSRSIDQPDPNLLVPQAMAKLVSRPTLFDQIIEEYCANRRDLLVRQLISALTRGNRPIEHRVLEPRRYVGDMLAWLHQALPTERDSVAYLLKNCETIDVSDRIQLAVCSITEGVCHPMKVRVEHILLGENNVRDPQLVQSVLGLLRYYKDIVHQTVGSGQLHSTLVDLVETCEKTLLTALTGKVAVLLGSDVEPPPHDLAITKTAGKVLSLLHQTLGTELSTSHESTQKIAACLVDPVLINITESATRLPANEAAVFLLNAYHSIESTLSLQPYLDDRLERLKAQSEAQMDTLTSGQASSLVAHLGLGAIYTALQGEPKKPLSRLPPFESQLIAAVHTKLAKVTANPELYVLPQLTLLTSVSRRTQIIRRANELICSIYDQLHQAVHDPENIFIDPQVLLPLTPQAVQQALLK